MTMHQPITPELSVPALTSWLRDYPPNLTYTYQDPARCLLGQYLTAHGADEAISETIYETMPDYRAIAAPRPHTFGAALTRAEALLALPPPATIPIEEVPEKQATPSAVGESR